MGSADVQTEKLIKDKAKVLFFQKGYLNATTQEIADEAGVNRALIHYYFRSREQMMDTLLDEALVEKKEKVRKILTADLPFREKIANYIETMVDHGLTYPYLDNFIISETARYPDKVRAFCSRDSIKSTDLIQEQLEEEIAAGRMVPISPQDFMVNLAALCNYPILAKPVLKTIYGMTDTTYREFLNERKQTIYMTLFGERMPQTQSK
ncbi:TetR/AcrR family transcriptional regulator [Marinoscillum sp. 108]|jgi:AcrR family transcriptional regulator|uniref:TetR/AcrR family transcriptional regulator n=1 Tax=Marinoscillum sp. 108 TaxID=2653151 RepID=UPI0012F3B0D4|nr:TetR/AcrR family transcriptional regulator [Marinoscillum sp. 108]VXD18627.1 TetR/AcrR family transcriptional regulator [Marinoscillum sp. 108]